VVERLPEARGTKSLDGLVRQYIYDRLSYRFVVVPDGLTASRMERMILGEELGKCPS
jgi:hypothetical protein